MDQHCLISVTKIFFEHDLTIYDFIIKKVCHTVVKVHFTAHQERIQYVKDENCITRRRYIPGPV